MTDIATLARRAIGPWAHALARVRVQRARQAIHAFDQRVLHDVDDVIERLMADIDRNAELAVRLDGGPPLSYEVDDPTGEVTAFNDDLRVMAIGVDRADAEDHFQEALELLEFVRHTGEYRE